MNVLSLFDGISTGRYCLEQAGIKVDNYFASEINPNAIKISENHYPDIIRRGDVTQVSAKKLPTIAEPGNVLISTILEVNCFGNTFVFLTKSEREIRT